MNKQSKWPLAAVALALAAALPLGATTGTATGSAATAAVELLPQAAPHSLLELSVDLQVPERPVVNLALDGQAEYESFMLEDPDRLVVDMVGVVSRLERHRFQVEQGGVVRARAGQHRLEPVPVTRVVFDLEQPLSYDIERNGSGLVVSFSGGVPAMAGETEHQPARAPARADDGAVLQAHNLSPPQPAHPAETIGTQSRDAERPAAPPSAVASAAVEIPPATSSRVASPDAIESMVRAPAFAMAQAEPRALSDDAVPPSFKTRTIVTDSVTYSGKRISLNLVDADVKQVFRLFHEISGLNFVLDPAVTGRVTIVLDDVPWDQALDIILKNNGLDKVLENNVIRIASTKKLAEETAARKQLKDARELEVELITITRTLSYAKAEEVARVLLGRGKGAAGGGGQGAVLSPRGRLLADERTNTLIISDVPSHIETVEAILVVLDNETPQVMIEARVVETSRDFVQDLGIVWGLTAIADASRGTSTGLAFPHNASARYDLNLPGAGGASNLALGFGNVIDSFTLDIALKTLEQEGQGRILSSPKVAAQNNEPAEIEQGVRIPIVNTTATEINVEFVSASLKMVVTPQITAENTIILDVLVENNSPDFLRTAGGIPSIRTQRAQTKVLINDGGTTVIGGIFTVAENKSESGVPWFRKIPIFGWLFKTQNITNQNRELLIFITPKIMRLA